MMVRDGIKDSDLNSSNSYIYQRMPFNLDLSFDSQIKDANASCFKGDDEAINLFITQSDNFDKSKFNDIE